VLFATEEKWILLKGLNHLAAVQTGLCGEGK
jgi:hypothetical protein